MSETESFGDPRMSNTIIPNKNQRLPLLLGDGIIQPILRTSSQSSQSSSRNESKRRRRRRIDGRGRMMRTPWPAKARRKRGRRRRPRTQKVWPVAPQKTSSLKIQKVAYMEKEQHPVPRRLRPRRRPTTSWTMNFKVVSPSHPVFCHDQGIAILEMS